MIKTKFNPYLIIVFIVAMCSSCVEMQDVELKEIKSYAIKDITKEKIEVEIIALIENPNNFKISVVDSDLDVYLQGQKLGKTQLSEKITLEKNSTSEKSIVVSTPLSALKLLPVDQIMKAMFSQKLTYSVKGKIKGKAFGISKNIKVDLEDDLKINKEMLQSILN